MAAHEGDSPANTAPATIGANRLELAPDGRKKPNRKTRENAQNPKAAISELETTWRAGVTDLIAPANKQEIDCREEKSVCKPSGTRHTVKVAHRDCRCFLYAVTERGVPPRPFASSTAVDQSLQKTERAKSCRRRRTTPLSTAACRSPEEELQARRRWRFVASQFDGEVSDEKT
nr:hypothetical protein Iba_chr05dCG9830 [Ipomoea batatas]